MKHYPIVGYRYVDLARPVVSPPVVMLPPEFKQTPVTGFLYCCELWILTKPRLRDKLCLK